MTPKQNVKRGINLEGMQVWLKKHSVTHTKQAGWKIEHKFFKRDNRGPSVCGCEEGVSKSKETLGLFISYVTLDKRGMCGRGEEILQNYERGALRGRKNET